MGKFRAYVKPFDADGQYLTDFIDISDDLLKVGDINISIDNSDFNVGIIKNSSVKVTLRNDHGRYSDADSAQSIFTYKRKNAVVKITWDRRSDPLICGFFKAGHEMLGYEEIIFEGVLSEVNSLSNVLEQFAEFSVLGYEAVLDEMEVPFDDLDATEDYVDAVFACLNQAPFNQLVTVDIANIETDYDPAFDTKDDLENKTVGEVLKTLLLDMGAVLYLKNNVVYVSPRTPTASSQRTFYGQGSVNGIEDILTITGYRDGVNRVFNYWTWNDTVLRALDTDSMELYGIKKKSLDSPTLLGASTTKINTILGSYRDEFGTAKIEFNLEATIEYRALGLAILDRVTVDYPTVYISADNNIIPRYGSAAYGASRYPYGRWDVTLDPGAYSFKILGIKYSPTKNTVTFKLREI